MTELTRDMFEVDNFYIIRARLEYKGWRKPICELPKRKQRIIWASRYDASVHQYGFVEGLKFHVLSLAK